MKSIFISAILFCNLLSTAQINIGAKGGISIPNLEGDIGKSKGYVSGKGTYGGLFVNFQLTPSFYLQPEINFSPQGGQRKGIQEVPAGAFSEMGVPMDVILYANFKSITLLNYIEIPVLAKFILGYKFKYYACAGPHISFLTEAKTKTSGTSTLYLDAAGTIPLMQNGSPFPSISFNNNIDIIESIKTMNAGVQGGLGIEYPAGPGNIFLESRVILGISNIQVHPEIDGKNQTGSLVIAAGYSLKIK